MQRGVEGVGDLVANYAGDRLEAAGLPVALEPAGTPPPGCRIRHGVLTLAAAAGTDLFVDPAGADPAQIPDASRWAYAARRFTLAAQVSVEFGSMYDAGVLLLHAPIGAGRSLLRLLTAAAATPVRW